MAKNSPCLKSVRSAKNQRTFIYYISGVSFKKAPEMIQMTKLIDKGVETIITLIFAVSRIKEVKIRTL